MKWVAGILVLIATTLPVGAPAELTPQELPDYYPLKPGTKWTYDLDPGNGRKIRVTNQVARIESIDGKLMARIETIINGRVALTQHLRSTPEGVFRYRMSEAEVSPPLCILKYPFREGETWEAKPMIGREQSKMSYRSGRHEDVTSTPTKYQAISVACDIDVDGTRITTTSWYSTDIGMVKDKREFGDKTITMNLVTFEPGH